MLALVAVAAALLVGLSSGAARTRHDAGLGLGRAEAGLHGGSSSIDGLVGELLDALARGDRAGLDALRVSESEYRGWIVPGSVEPGEPPQILGEDASRYFWEILNTKSVYYRDALLQDFGGRELAVSSKRFLKGTKRYANHTAHRRLELVVRDASGRELELQTGSIAEVDGTFKFISFIRD
jgi:hypothetical protein